MKDNYSGMVALLEYMDRKTQTHKQPKGSGRKTKMNKKYDLVELLRQKRDETELLEKFLEEQAKLKKKEEKKEDKKRQFIGLEWYVIGLLSYPLVGYLSTVIK